MKTKIIYISGNEVFDMADIRAAFDTVRGALGLDNNTILFGVPVDRDDAFAGDTELVSQTPVVEPAISIPSDVVEPQPEPESDEPPVQKPKRTPRRATARVVPIASASNEDDTADGDNPTDTKPETAIPILSVLGNKSDATDADNAAPLDEPVDVPAINITPINDEKPDVTEPEPQPATIIAPDTQSVSIADMLSDTTPPVEPDETDIAELLARMTPLAADEKDTTPTVTESATDMDTPAPTDDEQIDPTSDTDATLELLAAEFAESEDKIVTPTKTETRGKIGKLKNILPFKKAKRDDAGIMGDLFGWAGVANDEDFTIPGFFTNASAKK